MYICFFDIFLTAILHRGLRNCFVFVLHTSHLLFLDFYFPFFLGLFFPLFCLDFYFPFFLGLFFPFLFELLIPFFLRTFIVFFGHSLNGGDILNFFQFFSWFIFGKSWKLKSILTTKLERNAPSEIDKKIHFEWPSPRYRRYLTLGNMY